jgi:hypothetical protein
VSGESGRTSLLEVIERVGDDVVVNGQLDPSELITGLAALVYEIKPMPAHRGDAVSMPFWHRHSHSWRRLGVSFHPGRAQGRIQVWGGDDPTLSAERLVVGLSTVTQQCTTCGRWASYTVTGDARTKDQADA